MCTIAAISHRGFSHRRNCVLLRQFHRDIAGMKMANVPFMQITTSHTSPEARAWLRGNPNPTALATNRFPTTENALNFVENLYAAGARAVLVGDPLVDADGYPYADTLLVNLPPGSNARGELKRLCEVEGPGGVPPGDFTMEIAGDQIRLWWD